MFYMDSWGNLMTMDCCDEWFADPKLSSCDAGASEYLGITNGRQGASGNVTPVFRACHFPNLLAAHESVSWCWQYAVSQTPMRQYTLRYSHARRFMRQTPTRTQGVHHAQVHSPLASLVGRCNSDCRLRDTTASTAKTMA